MKGLCTNTEIALRNGMQAHHEWSWDDRHLVRGKGVEFSIITIPHYCSRSERKLRLSSSARGGSRIFLRGGALVSCSTSIPINHIVFFFLQNTSCIRKPQVISGGGGVRTPCTLPLDPPLSALFFRGRIVYRAPFIFVVPVAHASACSRVL